MSFQINRDNKIYSYATEHYLPGHSGIEPLLSELAFSKRYNNRECHQQFISDDMILDNSVEYFRNVYDVLR